MRQQQHQRALLWNIFLVVVCCWHFLLTTTTTTAFLMNTNASTSITNRPLSSSSWSSKSTSKSTSTTSTTPSVILFAEKKNRPWNILQFVQQSSKFVTLFPTSSASGSSKTVVKGDVLWKGGSSRSNDFEFSPLDDVVMGGASYSTCDKGTGKWKGTVTDANNGGFVGIRSTPYINYDVSACTGIEWIVLTKKPIDDTIRLKIVVQDTTDFNGVGWTTSVDTNTKLTQPNSCISTFKIPFTTLKPTRFAKILTETENNNKLFNSSSIKAFQMTYSKFEYDGNLNPQFQLGDFEIQLLSISTY
mmetsp:Transcript_803/g.900  ORF Transcript_803/g.900 Transcript_803/m.900 type:complete len:302 (-) Transcript_803:164-1069(-)